MSDTPADPNVEEFFYLRVEVTRLQGTELYLKIPKGWRPSNRRDYELLGKAAAETTDNDDWDNGDDPGWENTLEIQSYTPISKEEAEQYEIYEIKPEEIKATVPPVPPPVDLDKK